MKIINPATEEVLRDVPEDNRDTLKKKFDALRSAQRQWYEQQLCKRIQIIKKFSDLLGENVESLSSVLTSEVGKPLQQSRNDAGEPQRHVRGGIFTGK